MQKNGPLPIKRQKTRKCEREDFPLLWFFENIEGPPKSGLVSALVCARNRA